MTQDGTLHTHTLQTFYFHLGTAQVLLLRRCSIRTAHATPTYQSLLIIHTTHVLIAHVPLLTCVGTTHVLLLSQWHNTLTAHLLCPSTTLIFVQHTYCFLVLQHTCCSHIGKHTYCTRTAHVLRVCWLSLHRHKRGYKCMESCSYITGHVVVQMARSARKAAFMLVQHAHYRTRC